MKVNSIERDIHLLESYAGMTHKMNDNQGRPKLDQAIEHILSDYKRVLKENERYQESDYETICLENNELSEFVDRIQSEYNDLINELLKLPECKLYGLKKCKKNALLIIKDEFIPVQKVKAKIEELKQEKKKYGNCLIEMYEDELVNRDIKILQELLESEE